MTMASTEQREQVLLGDEAVALGAIHAGVSNAYAYPGTPSTEIVEYLVEQQRQHGTPMATWSANEKSAYEEALGVSLVGKRALVAMKHVGLNVAADPFMNSALLGIHGGLLVVVADDPGMHSSQNEQDSRTYADFARVLCLEPAHQQEAYAMAREAFALSERHGLPVLLRIVTRLAHSRAVVQLAPPMAQRPLSKAPDRASWILLPSNARRQWHKLLQRQGALADYAESTPFNTLTLNPRHRELGVITTGIARNYYLENLRELGHEPSHLHLGAYPVPQQKVRALAAHVERLLVIEEGYPIVERQLRGLLPSPLPIAGKLTGELPLAGELDADVVRQALKLAPRPTGPTTSLPLPERPPQLCAGCPHADSFAAIKAALAPLGGGLVTSDIGCYTLGALPPYEAIDSCICMGASVSAAKGAADAGFHPVVAVIGDSTFLHSGVTPLMDAVRADANMTLVILDNSTVAMTGGQPTILPAGALQKLITGLGVDPAHLHVVEAHRKRVPAMTELLRRELDHRGLSVVIAVRECLETARKSK